MIVNRNPEYFLTIVQERSISRAAEKLYLSQSSLSQHLSKLEEALGARLLDRSQSPLSLTAAGALYRSYLTSTLFSYQKFLGDLTELDTANRQTVRLGFGSWRGAQLTPELLPGFFRAHPQVRVDLHEFPVSELYALMDAGKVDFAVMNTAPAGVPEGFVNEVIVYERILLVLNRNDPAAETFAACSAAGKPLELSLLEGKRLVTLDTTLTVGRHVGNFLQKNRLNFCDRLNSTNNTTVLRLVAAGLGFCFLVETGREDAARSPELLFFDLHSPDLSIPLSLVHRAGSYLPPLSQALMEEIRAYYQAIIARNSPSALAGMPTEQIQEEPT